MKSSLIMNDDTSGTGMWRSLFQAYLLWPILNNDENISVLKTCPPDPNFFAIQNSVMIQRWTTHQNKQLFDMAVYPGSQGGRTNIIYNIDDVMGIDNGEIPKFNPAYFHYSKPEIQNNIKHIIERSDFVLVTTDRLKQYYQEKYDIQNFIIMPNLLPRNWAFGLYQPNKAIDTFANGKQQSKIRIGIISSSSHFNVKGIKQCADTEDVVIYDNQDKKYKTLFDKRIVDDRKIKDVEDDIDDIIPVIRRTQDKFEWIIIGKSENESFKKLIDENLITVIRQTDIQHYMQLVSTLNLSFIIAPIKDDVFNQCKSDIKYLESAAVGSVLLTPDLQPYTENVPEKQRYKNNDDLINMLYSFSEISDDEFGEIINNQYEYLNQPKQIYNGPKIINQWLDDNIDLWRNILFMPRKGAKVHLSTLLTNNDGKDDK